MVMLLKILSFPIRLVLFLVLGLVALVVISLTQTLGILLMISANLVSAIGKIFTGGLIVVCLIELYHTVFKPDEFHAEGLTPFKICIFILILAVMFFLTSFLPPAVEKIYEFLLITVAYIWGFAKFILFCK
ncbi:MAG: hypothetical protein K2I06_11225 [Ruminococcus sp.]|nr:hypothetical protein [Ruminococcus sp.]